MKITRYLHLDSHGDFRITAKRGAPYDVAFKLNIELPDIHGEADLTAPNAATITAFPAERVEPSICPTCRREVTRAEHREDTRAGIEPDKRDAAVQALDDRVRRLSAALAAVVSKTPRIAQGTEGCSACDGSGRVEVWSVVYDGLDSGVHAHTYRSDRRPKIACPRCTEPDERERESPT